MTNYLATIIPIVIPLGSSREMTSGEIKALGWIVISWSNDCSFSMGHYASIICCNLCSDINKKSQLSLTLLNI